MDLLALIVLVATAVLAYSIDAILFGITFEALQLHYNWSISSLRKLLAFILGFAIFDNLLWPMAYILDVSFTIGNNSVAEMLDFRPNQSFVEFFGFSKFTFVIWLSQALLAKYVGEKLIRGNSRREL